MTLADVRRFAAAFPEVEESTHFGFGQPVFKVRKRLVGVRVDLAQVSEERVRELVEHAWRNKAPKQVVAAYDAR
ncbi:MAG TPA: hypothetical protein VG165_11505 [Solirubrobacteraceae bacterium]|jgi:hypothetical protein|nr:hypothetical protein [Solirubrobacteraceae bacterium]